MTKQRKKRNGRYSRSGGAGTELLRLAGILLLAAALSLAAKPGFWENVKGDIAAIDGERQAESKAAEDGGASGLTVHFLDVEKCNCVLAASADGHYMLIDAGSNDEAHTEKIVTYLKAQGVRTLDYLLITHPHKDHIRAVPRIINEFTAEEVLMGDFEAETVGTKTFEGVMDALEAKDQLVTRPQPGETYALGNSSFTILANDDSIETASEELNDCSIGLILTDGFHRFLFYGDGEERMEEKLLECGYDLNCDVMMVAHHGSKSSTQKRLLQAVRPGIAVISCGIDGDGERQEPSGKVLKRLEEAGAKIYRTDLNGTVIVTSGEDGLQVKTER